MFFTFGGRPAYFQYCPHLNPSSSVCQHAAEDTRPQLSGAALLGSFSCASCIEKILLVGAGCRRRPLGRRRRLASPEKRALVSLARRASMLNKGTRHAPIPQSSKKVPRSKTQDKSVVAKQALQSSDSTPCTVIPSMSRSSAGQLMASEATVVTPVLREVRPQTANQRTKSSILPRTPVSGTHASFVHHEIMAFDKAIQPDLGDFSKPELKHIISDGGAEVPAESVWDAEACVVKSRDCKKRVYIEAARRVLVEAQQKPLVRRGKLLRGEPPGYFIVSFYRCHGCMVKVEAYNQLQRCVHTLVLTKARMQDNGVPEPPVASTVERWLPWVKIVLDRLEFRDGALSLGKPLPEKNGLPKGFSLNGQNTLLLGEKARTGERRMSATTSSYLEGAASQEDPLQLDRTAVTVFFDEF